MAQDPHRILLITMGGTIAGEVAADVRAGQEREASEFVDLVPDTVDSLNQDFNIKIDIKHHSLCEVDSSNVVPRHWTELAELIKKEFDNYESFVVTHGTNTLGYTCAALTFALANSGKPIVLTGSQVPFGWVGSDALINLQNAIRVAVWKPKRAQAPSVRGVLAVFGSHIITGTRVKKSTEFDYDAFTSFSSGSLGRIGRIVLFNNDQLERHARFLTLRGRPEATVAKDLVCDARFDMRIASLTEFPGMSTDLFQTLVRVNGIQGFILRAFGAGDPCDVHRETFEWLKSEKIPIVVTTQAPNGNANFQVNDPGQYLKDHELAIPAYDMSIEAQTAKLGWLLAKKNFEPVREGESKMSYHTLCEAMVTDMHGEVNVMYENDR
jgi:L-asparaginase